MADRETVIKALEICGVGTNSCTKCPLRDDCNAALIAAIELLQEHDEDDLK